MAESPNYSVQKFKKKEDYNIARIKIHMWNYSPTCLSPIKDDKGKIIDTYTFEFKNDKNLIAHFQEPEDDFIETVNFTYSINGDKLIITPEEDEEDYAETVFTIVSLTEDILIIEFEGEIDESELETKLIFHRVK